MKKQQTIAVIGGTGKSGKYLINKLIQDGFLVRLLIRNPELFEPGTPQVTIIKGDARSGYSVEQLIFGSDAVISMLGQPKGELPIFSQATQNVINAMQDHRISRYIVITGLNVATPTDQKSLWVAEATAWMYAHYPDTTKDKQQEYELLQKSTLDWTLARLPLIELTENDPGITFSLVDCASERVSATSLAAFLVAQLSDTAFYKAAPFIAGLV